MISASFYALPIVLVSLILLDIGFSLELTYDILFDTGKFCSGRDSCKQGRNARGPIDNDWKQRNCFCDNLCTVYSDCCIDAPSLNIPSTLNYSSSSSSFSFECVTLKQYGSIYMISSCKDTWKENQVREACEGSSFDLDPFGNTPVTSETSGLTYKNYYCAVCNGDSISIKFWTPRLECPTLTGYASRFNNISSSFILSHLTSKGNGWGVEIDTEGIVVFHSCSVDPSMPETLSHYIRSCPGNEIIGSCSQDYEGPREILQLCNSYTGLLFGSEASYRNVHCALCNNAHLDDLLCLDVGPLGRFNWQKNFNSFSFAILFDLSGKGSVGKRCERTGQIYDPFFKKCRNVICGNDEQFFRNGICQSAFPPLIESTSATNQTYESVLPEKTTSTATSTPTAIFITTPTAIFITTPTATLITTPTSTATSTKKENNVELTTTLENYFSETSLPEFTTSLLFNSEDTSTSSSTNASRDISTTIDVTSFVSLITTHDESNEELLETTSDGETENRDITTLWENDENNEIENTNYNLSDINSKDTYNKDVDVIREEIDDVTTWTPPNSEVNTSPTNTSTTTTREEINNVTTTINSEVKSDYLNCPKIELAEDEFSFLPNSSVYISKASRIINIGEFEIRNTSIRICTFEQQIENEDNKFSAYLGYVSLACLGISVIFLFLHILASFLTTELQNLSGKNLLSLSIALLGSYLCFIASMFHSSTDVSCSILAVVMYYFFMASFVWMLIISFDVFRSLKLATKELRLSIGVQWKKFVVYSLLGWTIPLLFVILVILLDTVIVPKEYQPGFAHSNICWFSNKKALLLYFALPLGIIMLSNVSLFICSALMVYSATHSVPKITRCVPKINFHLYLRLAILMGLTWISGLIAGFIDVQALWILFIALNTLQGLFIFLAFTCTRKVLNGLAETFSLYPRSFTDGSTSCKNSKFGTGKTMYTISPPHSTSFSTTSSASTTSFEKRYY